LIDRGMVVGENFKRLHGVILDPAHCWLISIGDNVTMAPNVHVLAHDASTFNYFGLTQIGRVSIGNNVFIGASTIVLPNVVIGDNIVIGANSIVTHDLASNAVYAGNPARMICSIAEFQEKNRLLIDCRPSYGEEFTIRKNVDAKKKQVMRDALKSGVGYIK
jgi:maltose O-acetyltransferase